MDIIGRAAELFGNSPMLRMAGRTLSFNECNTIAEAIASHLNSRGILSGEIVAVVSPNSPELVMLLLGLLKAGIIAAPLNYRFPQHLLNKTLEKLLPRLVATSNQEKFSTVSTTTLASILDDTAHGKESCTTLEDNTNTAAPLESGIVEGMHRPITIIHSSGSSGEAKAAVHSFTNHWYSALGSNENIAFGTDDCWLLSLPLYHIGGYSLLFRSLISGGALALGEPNESLGQSLQNFPLTHLSLVPTQLYRLLEDQKSTALLRKLKAVLLGGSAAPKSLIEEALRKHIPLYLSYGSTEMASQIATTPAPITAFEKKSGKLLSYRELSVANDGELLVKGRCLFQGYLRDGLIQPQTDNDGWFHTSDIGTLSAKGEITILGRKDNMFISGGENIHPEEIERALMMIDGVLEAVVVPVSDDEYGQRPVAFIQSIEEEKPDEQAIIEAMQKMVGKLKTPIGYFPVRQWVTLPGSQKSDRAWYQKEASAPSRPPLEP